MSLQKRINPDLPYFDVLMEELRKFDSGDYGEHHILDLLQKEFGEAFVHFTNYRLYGREIDLLSVTDQACFLFEVKNIKGHVHIKSHPPQLIRTTEEGKVDIFKCPMSQLEMNAMKLRQFLKNHNIEMPIYAAVVFAFHNANIHSESKQFPIVISRDIHRFIWKSYMPREPVHEKVVQLLRQQMEREQYLPILAKYNLDVTHLRTGVMCSNCDYLPMMRQSHTWYCPNCQSKDRTAHKQALLHYQKLISNRITNKQCREFLHLRNRHEAKRILQSSCIASEGKTKGRLYIINY